MANVTRFDPRIDPLGELVDDIFKGFLVRPMYSETQALPRMRVEVAEKNGAYAVTAELPGVRKEDIQVDVDGTQVTLSAEVKREKEATETDRLLHSERLYGKVSRSFALPQELDEEKVEAKFKDGVLQLTLPKKVAPARKAITIQ